MNEQEAYYSQLVNDLSGRQSALGHVTRDSSFVESLLERQGSKTSKNCAINKQESLTSEDSLSGYKEGRRCSVTFKEPVGYTILIPSEPGNETASACDSEDTSETTKLLSDENDSPEIPLPEVTEISNATYDSENQETSLKKTKLLKQCSLNYDESSLKTTQHFTRSYTVPSSVRGVYSRSNGNAERPDQCPGSSDSNDSSSCTKADPGLGEQPTPPPRKTSRPQTAPDGQSALSKEECTVDKAKKSSNPFAIRRQASFMLKRSSWRASRFRSKSQGASTTKSKWDRSDRKEDDTSSTVPRVEMVPESGGCPSAQESASQAAQEILISSPGSSKARQKKFHRHFKTVPPDEKVLNYYSCALVADILLQGHLYITRNYFAFYSNVFGYVTKLLIPTTSVLKVTKEKTAYIIPNAVGVTTEEDKHVFGSLLSRDSTYKLMVQVWNAALAPAINTLPKPECEERLKEELEEPVLPDEESSLSGSESNLESKLISNSVDSPPKGNTQTMGLEVKSYHDMFSQTTSSGCGRAPFLTFLKGLPRPTLLLLISTGLLVLLFASATVLLYRIARLHQAPVDFSTRSMSEVHAYINSNLEHITKVRESLEKLSFLIEHGGKYHS